VRSARESPSFPSASRTSSPRRRSSYSSPAPNGSMRSRTATRRLTAWQICLRGRREPRVLRLSSRLHLPRLRDPAAGYGLRSLPSLSCWVA
jgi:hypothetical protein